MKNLILLISLFLLCQEFVHGQCNSSAKWPSSDVSLNLTNGSGTLQTVTTSIWTGEYSVFINVVSGNTYRFGMSLATAHITIKTGSAGASGTVVAQGTQPLTYTPTSSANLFVLYHNNSSCTSQNTARTTTVQCLSCTPLPPIPGDNCSNALDLGSLTSPQNGATNVAGVNNDISICSMGSSNDMIYYIDIDNGSTLNIGQTVNNYDSRHSLRYGGSCPGSIEIICTDDPDTQLETWTNNTGQTQRVYWIVAGFSTSSGTFTFAWDVVAPPTCFPASNLVVSNILSNSADFGWTAASPMPQVGYQWAVTTSATPPANGSLVMGTSASANNLNSDTQYWLHVRSDCGVDDYSAWRSASFRTPVPGGTCEVAHIVPSLPYTTTDNTSSYRDNYNGSPGSSGCGTTSGYLGGDDVVYAYTANFDGCITITMSPTATWSGIFVYGSCADIGTACLAGVANSGTTPRVISNFYVTTGQSYYFVISTFPSPQSTGFTLSIAECARDFTMATPYVDNTSLVVGQSTFASVFHNSVGANTSYSLFVNMGYYLSEDDQFDANDILLDTDVSVFNTNSLSNYETSFIQIPENTPTGEYYILFVSDHYDEYVEDNEGNNVASVAITVIEQAEGDDFYITAATVSDSIVSPGGTISASCLQNYSGSSEATLNVTMGYYYSTDAIWDASDVLLNTDESTLSASDTADEEDANLTIPLSAVAGTAYILFVADHTDAFEETNEDNNVSAVAITIDAPPVGNDFFITNAATNHAQRNPGQSLSMSCHQSYAGSSFSTLIVRMGYYLSTDDQFDAGDFRLGTDNSGLSATKTSEYEDLTRNIPFGTAHGYYYILFVADDNGIYAETNENNNTVAIPITIGNPPANRMYDYNQQAALEEIEKSEDLMFSNNRNRNDILSTEIKMSPNPFSHFITVDWQNGEIEAMDCIIRDHTGRMVSNFKNVNPGAYLETNNLISGMYVLEMYTLNGTLINRFKVIKVE